VKDIDPNVHIIIFKKMIRTNGVTHPQNFSRDPKVGPKAKHRKKKGVGARSLIRNISGLGRHDGALGWG
jgi:hypothetical protein